MKSRKDLLNLIIEIAYDLYPDDYINWSMHELLILCNPNITDSRYNTFYIPKKSGGFRKICSPNGVLKIIQSRLNEIFKSLYTPSPFVMGFTSGHSVVDNAKLHTNQNYVFNIDILDFFPSIDQARVWKRLQMDPFNFPKEVANIVAGLCAIKIAQTSDEGKQLVRYILPQGAPTSPLLSNAICDTLDRRLNGMAKRFGVHYSRYADDITFSSKHNVYQPESEFRIELDRIITSQNFIVNSKKVRLYRLGKRQEVTGLTVNTKVNVPRKFVKNLRAILHIWEKYGVAAATTSFLSRYLEEKAGQCTKELNLTRIIAGKLGYLKMVKGSDDPVYKKLHH